MPTEPNTPLPLDLPAAISAVLAQYPTGAHIHPDGSLVSDQKPQPRRVTSIDDLRQTVRRTRCVRAEINGELIEFEVRGLNAAEQRTVDSFTEGLVPPQKFRTENGRQVPDGYNYDDPAYLKQLKPLIRKKVALIIQLGLVGIHVPGENVDQVANWLDENLTPQAIDLLHAAIVQMTSDPIRGADFS
jgi:hypothetical protein